MQSKRDEANVRFIQENDVQGDQPLLWLTRGMDKIPDASKLPATLELLGFVTEDIDHLCFKLKYLEMRQSPHQLEPRITSALMRGIVPPHPAFPSGHSRKGFMQAEILSKLLPTARADFMKRAEEVAESRIAAGIHFRSDNVGSKNLVERVLPKLEKNKLFQKDLAKAQKEWQALLPK